MTSTGEHKMEWGGGDRCREESRLAILNQGSRTMKRGEFLRSGLLGLVGLPFVAGEEREEALGVPDWISVEKQHGGTPSVGDKGGFTVYWHPGKNTGTARRGVYNLREKEVDLVLKRVRQSPGAPYHLILKGTRGTESGVLYADEFEELKPVPHGGGAPEAKQDSEGPWNEYEFIRGEAVQRRVR